MVDFCKGSEAQIKEPEMTQMSGRGISNQSIKRKLKCSPGNNKYQWKFPYKSPTSVCLPKAN